jgi:hypothetical protein
MNKHFIVLGPKMFPVKDPASEADNPCLFYRLERAIEVAKQTKDEDKEFGWAAVAEVNILEEYK